MTTLWKRLHLSLFFILFFGSFSFFLGVEQTIAPSKSLANAQSPYKHTEVIEQLIKCESQGRNVKIIDANGFYSYGILQYQSSTWNAWSELSSITGSPMHEDDAIQMADWAIDHGFLPHWSCAYKLGLLK